MLILAILWSTAALAVVVVIVVLAWLMLAGPVTQRVAATQPVAAASPAQPPSAAVVIDNIVKLLELPAMNFPLLPLLALIYHADTVQWVLAWVFMGLRVVHGFLLVGVRSGRVAPPVYWLSSAVLFVLWVGFFVDLLSPVPVGHALMPKLMS